MLTPEETALRGLLERTGVSSEVAARISRNAGMSPARTVRLLHSLLGSSVATLRAVVGQVFAETEQRARDAELDALYLDEMDQDSSWTSMALTNFNIVNMIEINHDGKIYDLHNFADFRSLSYDFLESRLSLGWFIREYDRTTELNIEFEAVDYLAVDGWDQEKSMDGKPTLEHLAYLPPNLLHQRRYFVDPAGNGNRTSLTAGESMLVQLVGGRSIVVHAGTAKVEVQD